MAVSKITLNGVTQMDVTQDTVTADKLLETYTATAANGQKIVGTYVPSGGGTGFGERTYIIKDGRVVQGYTFTPASTTTIGEETTGGTPYFRAYTAGNQYGSFWSNEFDISTYTYLVLELAEIDGHYGRTWGQGITYGYLNLGTGATNGTNNLQAGSIARLISTSGYIQKQRFICGTPTDAASSTGHIKIQVTGTSSYDGYINIKNLYFVSEDIEASVWEGGSY